ncbi:MAG: helix-turn-helix transcriptional regulator [Lactobacillaceae bacterium]|jgi:transcriptional regulator with XRE-family HTH domain|nr:helix-turn-helix transcriptional regulator [Lactobacillaceae bacterium]
MSVKDNIITLWKAQRPDIPSIRVLEKEIGLSNGALNYWTHGNPSGKQLNKLADFFNVSPDDILDLDRDTYMKAEDKLPAGLTFNDLTKKITVPLEHPKISLSLDGQELTPEQQHSIIELLRSFKQVFDD